MAGANEQLWTGQGATITFTGNITFEMDVRTIGAINVTLAALDDTNLNSADYMEKVPASLKDIDPIEIEVYWDYTDTDPLAEIGDVGSLSITLPDQDSTGSGGGTITFSGFFTSMSLPALEPNERTIGTVTFQPDGVTVTYSAETTA